MITVDVEDWFQVENLRPVCPIESWEFCDVRVEENTRKLLELFDRHSVQTTFFVLGWVAQRFPGLVREIKSKGHEIASHGYMHLMLNKVSDPRLREFLYRSKSLLEDISGEPVLGYRAAGFSITRNLFNLLGELGFQYDSSYNSFRLNQRYGSVQGMFPASCDNRLISANGIIELPLSNLKINRFSMPWAGGGFFRFWPQPIFEWGVSRILRHENHYIFYCHPWEFDPGQPRVNGIGAFSRFRHYLNLDKTLDRLNHFLVRYKECKFLTCKQYIESLDLAP
ncbi:XrtA system polysaccharide deacetylase [Syntrophorhabdus aromaticivorans]|uniref:DUF3473 domain-containing protein n=1 Tax=Syntrophorhabdus aromaticivorans TaxID=328301 RepID=A0A971M7I4_9BACT|nr:XrtA system polysaccharide deacetylase [Syntrophorhabdus aromaticivorans]NLW36651.1 DUF3473 domain-containing protein [Syntrophorhabdus aromaticivorans]